MALYFTQVSIDIPVVVQTEDSNHAWDITINSIKEFLGDLHLQKEAQIFVVREVKHPSDLPKDWDDLCIPYGGDGNTRIAEILGRIEGDGE